MHMMRKIVLAFTCLGVASAVTLYLLSIPLLRRLPKPGRKSMDGITTINDAVEACRRTRLEGWEQVSYAQQLVARKFTYSRLNTWDTPSRAFERGMGYCEQQALALKKIYDRLGIAARPVFSLRCKFPAKVVDGIPWSGGVSGHAWLRVRIGDEELDVCSGSVNNKPGVTHFEVLSKMHIWHPWLRPLTHLGSSIENIRRDMMARHGLKGAARSPIDTRLPEGASAQPA
jgi:transglutaminase superfamily protein